MSYLIRATNQANTIRLFAIDSKEVVAQAARLHHTSPVMSAALGRSLSAALMMGAMMKEEKAKLTLRIRGGGPAGTILCVADSMGHVKGSVGNAQVDLPLRPDGKLDVGGALGTDGAITVIRDLGLKEPWSGQYPLVSGEIGDDLTAFFAYSDQVPSAVGVGVLVDVDYSIRASGGFIVQMMPFCPPEHLEQLEKNLSEIASVTALLDEGKTPEDLAQLLLAHMDPVIHEKMPVSWRCDCSREKTRQVLESLGEEELELLIEEDGKAEVMCHFCNTGYQFSKPQLLELLEEVKRS